MVSKLRFVVVVALVIVAGGIALFSRGRASPKLLNAVFGPRESVDAEVLRLERELHRLQRRLQDEPQVPAADEFSLGTGLPRVDEGAQANFSSIDDFAKSTSNGTVSVDDSPDEGLDDHATIFVSMASFRDVECEGTIAHLFAQAKNPLRVFVGAVEQHEGEASCLPETLCPTTGFCLTDNVRVRRLEPKEAKGPTHGRYVSLLMYRGEKYFMLLDSHNRFRKHWDAVLIAMLRNTNSKKPVLSHYPGVYNGPSTDLTHVASTIVMCNAHFIDDGYLRLDGAPMGKSDKPRLQPFAAAGFLFADAALVHEVPLDPYLDFLFDGEEILYSARMWTHGWDIFSPSEEIMFHFYVRQKAPKVWSVKDNNWWGNQRRAIARVQYFLKVTKKGTRELIVDDTTTVLNVLAEKEKYGLGKARSLDAYWKFARVDPISRSAGDDFCRYYR